MPFEAKKYFNFLLSYFAIPYISVVISQIYNTVYDDETDKAKIGIK